MHEKEKLPLRRSPEQLIDEKSRRYYDTATLIAEALDGVMYSEFPLGYDGEDIYSRKDGTRFGTMMLNSLQDAREMVRQNPNYAYELRRREKEAEELQIMIDMANDDAPNTLVVVSDFPPVLMDALEDTIGYNVRRKQTMLRIVTKHEDGSFMMRSQTLDGSNRQALEAIYGVFDQTPEDGELLGQRIQVDLSEEEQVTLNQRLVDTYDASMIDQFGGRWIAGRKLLDGQNRINTFDFVNDHNYMMRQYLSSDRYGDQKLLKGLIFQFDNAYQKVLNHQEFRLHPPVAYEYANEAEMRYVLGRSAQQADQEGKIYSACGATMSKDGTNDFEVAYGEKSKEELSWHGGSVKKGTCVNCKEGPKDVGVESWCKSCIKGHCG